MTSQLEQAVFITDDRDKPLEEKLSLRILQGGNGDWYVSIAPLNQVAINGVRISTSGGASISTPGLTAAIADAYAAIKNAEQGKQIKTHEDRRDMEEELAAWRSKFDNYVFDGLHLCEKKKV